MSEYRKVPTTVEVCAALQAFHGADLKIFSSYKAPNGDQFGDPSKSVIMAEYGFMNAVYPIFGIKSTWDNILDLYERKNEKSEYWLCIPTNNIDEYC